MPTGALALPVRTRRLTSKTSSTSSSLIITVALLLISSTLAEEDESQVLLKFKNSLENSDALSNWNPGVLPCQPGSNAQGAWVGVLCYKGNVFGLQLEKMNLRGKLNVDPLVSLRALRTLSFMDNKLEGSMPDWRKLGALKSLYLSNNEFSGEIAEDAFKGMTSLKKVYLSNNKFTGKIPSSLESPKLIELRLENNQFTGPIPAISSEFLKIFNVSNNQLEGPIPDLHIPLDPSSFAGNKGLCGKPLDSSCNQSPPPPSPDQNTPPPPSSDSSSSSSFGAAKIAIIVSSIVVALILLILLVLFFLRKRKSTTPQLGRAVAATSDAETSAPVTVTTAAVPASHTPPTTASGELNAAKNVAPPPKKVEATQAGKLSFVREDAKRFELQDLMSASAEVLGSGNFGASYKAVLVDGETMVVKRFKQMNVVGREDFQEHMRRLGRLGHTNLLPLVAYLYRKEEKLFVYDFVHHGSLSAQLHGKHSAEKPGLNWPTRLKIIKGVAKGLAYLQAELPTLVVPHGHLKSSNVLLDKDFNPLLMDYALVPLVNPNQVHKILVAYKSPEYTKQGRTTKKTDVWCFGILILEILTGKYVANYLSQGSTPYSADLAGWISDIAKDASACGDEVFDKEMSLENRCVVEMEKLLQIGIACCREELEERLDLDEAVRQIEQVQVDSSSSSSSENLE